MPSNHPPFRLQQIAALLSTSYRESCQVRRHSDCDGYKWCQGWCFRAHLTGGHRGGSASAVPFPAGPLGPRVQVTGGDQGCLPTRLATISCSHPGRLTSCQSFPRGMRASPHLRPTSTNLSPWWAVPQPCAWPVCKVALCHVPGWHRNSPVGGRAALGMGCSCQAARWATNLYCCGGSMSLPW